MTKLLRGAWVIGRRDFSATVLSKTFLFFLFGPLFPLLFGVIFGGIVGGTVVQRERPVVGVIATADEFAPLAATNERLGAAVGPDRALELIRFEPRADVAAQGRQLLASGKTPVRAVLTGVAERPRLTGDIEPGGITAGQVRLLLAYAGSESGRGPELSVIKTSASSGSLARDRSATGQVAQGVLFFLTLLLSTMLLSQMVEEKSNKIIEVVAAAVPVESLFVGKLFAMAAASLLGLLVWAAAGAAVVASVKTGGLAALPAPATGWPAFLTLTAVYFAINYLLFGALFLTIGAQAATVREVQTLSMPITFGQILILALAATAVAAPNSPTALIAEIFPLSSPLAMTARAAHEPALWPHIAAVLWQLLWIAVILRLGAALFRKTVLKSGPRARWWRKRPA